MFPSLLSSKPFPLQPLLAALSSPPPLSRPLSRFSACSQICFWLSASAPPLQPLCPLLNLCWLSALAPPFYRPAPLAASLFALKFVLAERFSAPFCRPKLPPKFVVAQRFSAPFSAFFAFALLPPLLPHPSSLAFLGFSLAIILVPAKALASGPLSRFRLLFPLSGFFSSPFLIFPCHNFGAGEGFSLGAAFSLSPLFLLP